MNTRMTKNYKTDGGDRTIIGGVLEFENGAKVKNFPGAANQAASSAADAAGIVADFNALLIKLKNAGVMIPDDWNVSVLACPTTAGMPTAQTIANSGHATVAIDGTEITITLDCKVSDLANADHGATWGEHKWLGFGVRTGLNSVVGVVFTDGTGAETTLASGDATEATSLGLSAGDFVLYIKAEDPYYLTGEKYFTLCASGYAETKFTMRIVEAEDD